MSEEEDTRKSRADEGELRKLAYEDADRTFVDPDRERLTPKLPFDPPKLQWKDTVGDPQPKWPVLDPKNPILDPKNPVFDPKQPWFDPPKHLLDPPKQPWQDPEPKSIIEDKGGFDPPKPTFDPKQPWQDPEPKSIIEDKGGFDPPKQVFDPPKPQWKDLVGDPEPKRIVGDPKQPKADLDPDPKNVLDPKNVYDPPKAAYDPGPVFDPGRVFDPGAAARRPFVLGMPHHAPGAGAMAGADPRATAMQPSGAEGATDSAAYLEATLAQVESSMRMLKADLEQLDDYYSRLRERLEQVEAAEATEGGKEDEGEE